MMFPLPDIEVVESSSIASIGDSYDSYAFVFTSEFVKNSKDSSSISLLSSTGFSELLSKVSSRDRTFGKDVMLNVNTSSEDSKVIVTSPTGPLSRDYDDVRRYGDAAAKAIKRLRQGGFRRPLLIIEAPQNGIQTDSDPLQDYSRYLEVSILSALAESFETLQTRETDPTHVAENLIEKIGIISDDTERAKEAVVFAKAVEEGRRLARDIGSSDPERMTALRAADYIEKYFGHNSGVSCKMVTDQAVLSKEYPLLMAVARASLHVPRHAPCVVELEYKAADQAQVEEDLYFIGKGITYDTGGADIKVGGNMAGMSRDKCGAAAVAGFIATASILKPAHVNIRARLAFVRNSIGADAYVCDEIITSRSGVRVRVGNTDAEGRMVMADLLARAKEEALASKNSEKARLFTVATLTGHAVMSYGPYVAALDNAMARRNGVASRLFKTSLATGDPFELSTLRREDFTIVAPADSTHDVLQCNRKSSVGTSRGHQYPMAFMITAAGLTANKKENEADGSKISYTHLDIAGAAEESSIGGLGRCTGAPIPTLSAAYLFKRFATKLL